jgi:hypothetical protein
MYRLGRTVKSTLDRNRLSGECPWFVLIIKLISGLPRGIVEYELATHLHACQGALLSIFSAFLFHHLCMRAHPSALAVHDLASE